MDNLFGQVPRALESGARGPESFKLLLTHFDRADTGENYAKLHKFGVSNGIPFFDFSQEFEAVVSAATGTERILVPGVEVVLETV